MMHTYLLLPRSGSATTNEYETHRFFRRTETEPRAKMGEGGVAISCTHISITLGESISKRNDDLNHKKPVVYCSSKKLSYRWDGLLL